MLAEKALLTMRPVDFDYWAEIIPLLRSRTGAREVPPIHEALVRYSTHAHCNEMITPAEWAHLDYDADEAEVQLRETIDFEGTPIVIRVRTRKH